MERAGGEGLCAVWMRVCGEMACVGMLGLVGVGVMGVVYRRRGGVVERMMGGTGGVGGMGVGGERVGRKG